MLEISIENLSQKINDILSSIKEISSYIKNHNTSNKESELKEQLIGIQKTISSFEQKHLSIPSGLRDLKSSLINELSEIEELNKIINDFQNELKSILNIKLDTKKGHNNSKVDKTESKGRTYLNIKLSDIVSAGFIMPNSKIIHKGRDVNSVGTISQNGRIYCNIRGSNKSFETLSGAAEAIEGGSRNGWEWWFIQNGEKLVPLSKIRDLYLNNIK